MRVLCYVSELIDGPFPCFSCGQEMTEGGAEPGHYTCEACEVSEARVRTYLNKTELVSSFTDPVTGETVPYVNHAVEHHPSPA